MALNELDRLNSPGLPLTYPTEHARYEVLPSQSICLTTTAKGTVTIEVKVTNANAETASQQAEAIFDRLRTKYRDVNEANKDFYTGKG